MFSLILKLYIQRTSSELLQIGFKDNKSGRKGVVNLFNSEVLYTYSYIEGKASLILRGYLLKSKTYSSCWAKMDATMPQYSVEYTVVSKHCDSELSSLY